MVMLSVGLFYCEELHALIWRVKLPQQRCDAADSPCSDEEVIQALMTVCHLTVYQSQRIRHACVDAGFFCFMDSLISLGPLASTHISVLTNAASELCTQCASSSCAESIT